MRVRREVSTGLASLAFLFLLCAGPAIAAMHIASTTMPLPEDDKPVLLAGLAYGGEWSVAFNSIRLERDSKASGDPVRPVWTLVASSSRPMVQKVIIEIHLLDGSGKTIKATKKFVVVKANTAVQEIPIKMKVKRADWERAERVRIKSTFTVL